MGKINAVITGVMYYQSKGSFVGIRHGDSIGYAFAVLVDADDDEVAGFAASCYKRRFYFKAEYSL